MKRILIPTDFTIDSLQLVEYAFLNFPDEKLGIILLGGYELPGTKWGVTHFNQQDAAYKLFDDDFVQGKRRLIRERKSQLAGISYELYTGKNAFAFRNFIEQLGADSAIVPNENRLSNADSHWFDTTSLIKENLGNVLQVPMESKKELSLQRKSGLVDLFS